MMLDFATYPLESAHDKIMQFCKNNGIDVLNLLPRFEHETASDLTVFLDGHPNSLAHKSLPPRYFTICGKATRWHLGVLPRRRCSAD